MRFPDLLVEVERLRDELKLLRFDFEQYHKKLARVQRDLEIAMAGAEAYFKTEAASGPGGPLPDSVQLED